MQSNTMKRLLLAFESHSQNSCQNGATSGSTIRLHCIQPKLCQVQIVWDCKPPMFRFDNKTTICQTGLYKSLCCSQNRLSMSSQGQKHYPPLMLNFPNSARRFLGIISQNPSISKSNRLHVLFFGYFFINLKYTHSSETTANTSEVLNFNQLFLKLNWPICNQWLVRPVHCSPTFQQILEIRSSVPSPLLNFCNILQQLAHSEICG